MSQAGSLLRKRRVLCIVCNEINIPALRMAIELHMHRSYIIIPRPIRMAKEAKGKMLLGRDGEYV